MNPHPPPNLPLEGGGARYSLSFKRRTREARYSLPFKGMTREASYSLPFKGRARVGMGYFKLACTFRYGRHRYMKLAPEKASSPPSISITPPFSPASA